MAYYNGGQTNYGGNYNNGYGQQTNGYYGQQQQQETHEFDDYYTQNNASTQWDSRSAKSSHTVHSNYSSQPINKPYEQPPPMPVVDYPPTHRVQFPGGFGGPQRQHTSDSAGFHSAREKLMRRRVSPQHLSNFKKTPHFCANVSFFWGLRSILRTKWVLITYCFPVCPPDPPSEWQPRL